MEYCKRNNFEFITRYPRNFSKDKKYPVIFFLHGAGGERKDLDNVKSNLFFSITEEYEDFPFICIAPLCYANLTWNDVLNELKDLVKFTASLPYTDYKHFYLMGNSMGGYGTWQLAMSMPEYFAAIVPICGGGMYWNAGRLVNVPVWAFHGAKDDIVFAEESVKMVEAINAAGGNAKYTIYEQNGHDAWSDTYSNKAVFDWLLQHENTNDLEIIDKYDDVKKFG